MYHLNIQSMLETCYEAYNEKDLIKYFYELSDGKDIKADRRKGCIEDYFSKVHRSSQSIVNALAKKI